MPAAVPRVVFAVENDVQWGNALAVGAQLPAGSAAYLDLWTATIVNGRVAVPAHNVGVTLGRLRALAAEVARLERGTVVVLPQDMGLLQRMIARRARMAGARMALLPDGVVASRPVRNGSRRHRAARRIVHETLRMAGYSSGSPGQIARTEPGLILSWGPGWREAFWAAPYAEIADVGCPRMDCLSSSPPPPGAGRVLLCSQPLFVPASTRPFARAWYRFILDTLEQGGDRVRLRLHPAERGSENLPAPVREADAGHAINEDLAWCDVVASPFSSTAVDALAAGRMPLLLEREGAFDELVRSIPLFADPRLPRVPWDPARVLAAQALVDLDGLTDDYLAHRGRASHEAAAALIAFATSRQP